MSLILYVNFGREARHTKCTLQRVYSYFLSDRKISTPYKRSSTSRRQTGTTSWTRGPKSKDAFLSWTEFTFTGFLLLKMHQSMFLSFSLPLLPFLPIPSLSSSSLSSPLVNFLIIFLSARLDKDRDRTSRFLTRTQKSEGMTFDLVVHQIDTSSIDKLYAKSNLLSSVSCQ
jgi:hypothetical protein